MLKNSIKILMLLLIVITLIACNEDNSTKPETNFLELDIPDNFNWTNLDHININVDIQNDSKSLKSAIYVKHEQDTLAVKFYNDEPLDFLVSSVKGYETITIECPSLNFSKEVSTSIKSHDIVIDGANDGKFTYGTNVDAYFADTINDDDSNFISVSGVDPNMAASYLENNIYVPTAVPEAGTGWSKYKFNEAGTGEIKQKTDGILNYVQMGTDWVIMQTINVENYTSFNENLEGRTLENTMAQNDCPNNSYMTMFYMFLDENNNLIDSFPWPPWSYSDSGRFYADRTENEITAGTKNIVLVGQYNGTTGTVRLDSWLDTFYSPAVVPNDTDGDGIVDDEDLYPRDANFAGRVDYPAGIMMFEDLWPDRGDYDFNDLYLYISDVQCTTNSENKVAYLDVYYRVLKNGASLHNGLGMRIIGATGEGDNVTYQTVDTGDMVQSAMGYSLPNNWETGEENGDWDHMVYKDPFANNSVILIHDISQMNAEQKPGTSIRIILDPSQEQPENPIPDFFLFRSSQRQREIHLATYPPTNAADMAIFDTGEDNSLNPADNWYKTSDNYPWALYFSADSWVPVPKENIPIFRAYPDFAGWVTSGGESNQNWINNYDSELTESPWSK